MHSFQAAVRVQATDPLAHFRIGNTLFALKKYAEARKVRMLCPGRELGQGRSAVEGRGMQTRSVAGDRGRRAKGKKRSTQRGCRQGGTRSSLPLPCTDCWTGVDG